MPIFRTRIVFVAAVAGLVGISFAVASSVSPAITAAAAADTAPAVTAPADRPRQALVIVTPQGRTPFLVEVVDDAAGRRQGLMGRRELAPDAGMLFDYGMPVQTTMWMKDTPLSLDMIFIAEDGRVVRVAEQTEPFAETLIPSFVEVRAVLEVVAGTAHRLGIAPGTRIEHPIFAAGPSARSPH